MAAPTCSSRTAASWAVTTGDLPPAGRGRAGWQQRRSLGGRSCPGLSRLWAAAGLAPTPLPRPRVPAARASFLLSLAPARGRLSGPARGPEVAVPRPVLFGSPRPGSRRSLGTHSLAAATAASAAAKEPVFALRDRPTSPPDSAPAPPRTRGRGARPDGRGSRHHPLCSGSLARDALAAFCWGRRVCGHPCPRHGRCSSLRCGEQSTARPPPRATQVLCSPRAAKMSSAKPLHKSEALIQKSLRKWPPSYLKGSGATGMLFFRN